ncbi:MAG: hypothetical protein ACRCSM_09565 [Sediminibacterium sp.]|jgi:hypothetical protein|nr:hypothetical protein [Asinibacterium sp. OR53]MBR2647910.1 hypothetical protein [Sediminibacterium sp.]MCA6445587.1 hypothetical protein [Chitinophagaceae bacterium]
MLSKQLKIFFTATLLIISFPLFAQKERVRGIYKTCDDFVKGNLSFDNNCNIRNIRIRLNDFFSKKYITVKKGDSSLKLLKNDIFGYINCRNEVFRFKGKIELFLLNAGEQILIYKHIVSKPPTGRTNVTNYYFSLGVNSPVQKLTIRNLKNIFPANSIFKNFIDKNFRYNTDLAEFDKVNKMYKVNLLLSESLK